MGRERASWECFVVDRLHLLWNGICPSHVGLCVDVFDISGLVEKRDVGGQLMNMMK